MSITIILVVVFGLIVLGVGAWAFKVQVELNTLKGIKSSEAAKRAELEKTFDSLATQALQKNNEQFFELARTKLSDEREKTKGDLEQKEQSIANLLKPFKLTLDEYQKNLKDLEKARQSSYFQVETELKRVAEIGGTLSKETRALKDALKKPHIRGRWGEVQLKNCIDLAGMSEHCDISFQENYSGLGDEENKSLRPDAIVRMPGGRVVVVDAKTPLDAFLESLEVDTEEQRNACTERHAKQIKDHVKKLSEKKYSSNIKESADFTVMFLPNESFLYAALEPQPDLVEYALEKKILIATPPTFIGLLKVILFGWEEKKLSESAERMAGLGKELHKRIAIFVDSFDKAGIDLHKANDAFKKARASLESRVLVTVRQLEEWGAKSEKDLPKHVFHGENLSESTSVEPSAPLEEN